MILKNLISLLNVMLNANPKLFPSKFPLNQQTVNTDGKVMSST